MKVLKHFWRSQCHHGMIGATKMARFDAAPSSTARSSNSDEFGGGQSAGGTSVDDKEKHACEGPRILQGQRAARPATTL